VSFYDDLDARIRELKRAAIERYDEELRRATMMADVEMHLDDEGNLHQSGRPYSEAARTSQSDEIRAHGIFTSDLTSLVQRLEGYRDFNPQPYATAAALLGGKPGSGSWTVYGGIQFLTDHWIQPVLTMVRGEQWTGEAALAFQNGFLLNYYKTAGRQMLCVRTLMLTAEIYEEATRRAQNEIMTIVDSAIAAFSNERSAAENLQDFLTAAGIVIMVLGLYGGHPIVMEAGEIATGVIADSLDDGAREPAPPELTVEGGHAQAVMDSAVQRTQEFYRRLEDFRYDMLDRLGRARNSATLFASPEIEAGRPEISNDPTCFETLEIGAAIDVPIERHPVVESMTQLFRAGQFNLPEAADVYHRVRDKLLNDVTLPSGGTISVSQLSEARFSEFVDQLGEVFSRTEDMLLDAGANLVQIAQNYAIADEQRAEANRQITAMLDWAEAVEARGPGPRPPRTVF
jgi:hypothetical protein